MKIPREAIYAAFIILVTVVAGLFYAHDKAEKDAVYAVAAVASPQTMNSEEVSSNEAGSNVNETPPSSPIVTTNVKVYITGEVVNPGVYEINANARVDDVLALAGGATSEADLIRINLAAKIADGQEIIVPKQGDTLDNIITDGQNNSTENNSDVNGSSGLVNINIANAELLKTLPGVGDVIARRIIEYRDTHGQFTRIEDIMNVSRIGQKTFDSLKDFVTVN
ncbi:MAG: helix-hairpin-helix domain-containing protein [Clostridiales bacterium]|nr:helix-hairpin-helix domain-containing protein [Clostridiales bacterium]